MRIDFNNKEILRYGLMLIGLGLYLGLTQTSNFPIGRIILYSFSAISFLCGVFIMLRLSWAHLFFLIVIALFWSRIITFIYFNGFTIRNCLLFAAGILSFNLYNRIKKAIYKSILDEFDEIDVDLNDKGYPKPVKIPSQLESTVLGRLKLKSISLGYGNQSDYYEAKVFNPILGHINIVLHPPSTNSIDSNKLIGFAEKQYTLIVNNQEKIVKSGLKKIIDLINEYEDNKKTLSLEELLPSLDLEMIKLSKDDIEIQYSFCELFSHDLFLNLSNNHKVKYAYFDG